ncbi:hypothetical protein BZA77DRAFT_305668 [Pyronema omphalodes]|nr:hypothetical protein BZA77DRAFT_305668 [Pyronema omphalodes]
MKFSTVFAAMLFVAGTALAENKKYIITYPKGTDLSAAKQQLEADGMTIKWTYTLINALAVEGPEAAMDKFQVWTESNGPKPEIEEDQIVRTQKTSAMSSK